MLAEFHWQPGASRPCGRALGTKNCTEEVDDYRTHAHEAGGPEQTEREENHEEKFTELMNLSAINANYIFCYCTYFPGIFSVGEGGSLARWS